jgi:hypothetical protein
MLEVSPSLACGDVQGVARCLTDAIDRAGQH